MSKKEFLTTEQLIEKIESKKIIIKSEKNVKEILETNNYYFIMGYKFAFKTKDGKYKSNVSFEDIYSLYMFDKLLKLIFLNPILVIEQKLKTIYTNNYCVRYGFKKEEVLKKDNYDITNYFLENILASLNKQLAEYGNKNKAVLFYKNNHDFVPLWVYMKTLSFGMIRDMFFISKSNDKNFMKNKLTKEEVSINEINNMLRLLVRVRNICCHDDILLSYVDDNLGIKNTRYHKYFELIRDKNNNIIQGKKDLFAILISIKILVNKEDFDILIDNITNLINEYTRQIKSLNREQLLKIMHLPINFEKLKEY